MGAQEIIDILKKNPGKEFTSHEIANLLEISLISVSRCIGKLLEDPFDRIKKRELTCEDKIKLYGKTVNAIKFVYYLE